MSTVHDDYYEELREKRKKAWEAEAARVGLPVDLAMNLSSLITELHKLEDRIPYSSYKKIAQLLEKLHKYKAVV